MHQWGDGGVDWNGINDAADYIGIYLRKWGRVNVSCTKEKYGTVRVYCYLGWHQFHSITHPSYVYNQYPKWLWNLDCTIGFRIVAPLNRIVLPIHRRIYRKAYRLALAKWPHLRNEILNSPDWPELLVGL